MGPGTSNTKGFHRVLEALEVPEPFTLRLFHRVLEALEANVRVGRPAGQPAWPATAPEAVMPIGGLALFLLQACCRHECGILNVCCTSCFATPMTDTNSNQYPLS